MLASYVTGLLMRAPSVVDAGEQKEEDIINYDDPSVMIQRRLPIFSIYLCLMPHTQTWLSNISFTLPKKESDDDRKISRTEETRELEFFIKGDRFQQFSWLLYKHVTSRGWFEGTVMMCVLLLGVSNALEGDTQNAAFVYILTLIVTAVFGIECILKILTEGYKPWRYFVDEEFGPYNCFDFSLSALSIGLLFAESSAGMLAGSIRVLRLVRLISRNMQLFKFVKNVSQLRIIIKGLVAGLKSVLYIVILLALLIYLFAIIGCILFGLNDPAHFGTVGSSMVTLFVISTLSNWSDIAYTQWYGCSVYLSSPYHYIAETPPQLSPMLKNQPLGLYQGFVCIKDDPKPESAFLFFTFYIVITSWVVMSLFIGVISMGMLDAFVENFAVENKKASDAQTVAYSKSRSNGTMTAPPESENPLKIMIDASIDDVIKIKKSATSAIFFFQQVVRTSKMIRDSTTFSCLIGFLIPLVVIEIGISQDFSMHCLRHQIRVHEDISKECPTKLPTKIIFNGAQLIFMLEVAIKIVAEGRRWWRFFTDRENGYWNTFDLFIVVIGVFDLSPSISIGFPVYLLRLLRLLRLFRLARLARALPRLRSIVESLISGFSAVGWILLLIMIFNYTAGSICMYMFASNDPFHFGTLSRSMFSMLQFETLDNWDQILYIGVYGCKYFPAGYPFVNGGNNNQCNHSQGLGYVAVVIFICIAIIGAYILPTVLIGIISIKFDEQTVNAFIVISREEPCIDLVACVSCVLQKQVHSMLRVRAEIAELEDKLSQDMPSFFSPARNEILIELFEVLDIDERQELSYHDMKLLIHYLYSKLFGVELTSRQVLEIFEQANRCKNHGVRMNDFVIFIASIKRLSDKFRTEPHRAKLLSSGTANQPEINRGSWQAALDRIDVCALDDAWELILGKLQNISKVHSLHLLHKSRGAAGWSCENLDAALGSCGVRLNEYQLGLLYCSLDVDGDGEITSQEFTDAFLKKRLKSETPEPLLVDVDLVPESSSENRQASSAKGMNVNDIDQKLSQRNIELSELEERNDEIVAAIVKCKLEIDLLEYQKSERFHLLSRQVEVMEDSLEHGALLQNCSTWI